MKYIYHHLGLGDHIICNGLVRHYRETNDKIGLFVKPRYLKNVEYMYRDDENVILLPIGEDNDVERYIQENGINSDVVRVGFNKLMFYRSMKFDEAFYMMVGLPFDYRFSKYKFIRNEENEDLVYKELVQTDEPYIYVHDDKSRGFEIDRTKIMSNLRVIENDKRFLMFDMLKVIENATEVHTMQTGMKDLINCYEMKTPKFFLHTYVRNYDETYNTSGLNNFTKID